MELIELLKIINDQSNRADTQAKIEALKEAMIKINTTQAWFTGKVAICATVVFALFLIIEEIRWYKLDKRLKKLELANDMKDS